MKILIIHHLESMWESGYKKQGESFESLAEKVINHIKESDYDKVILTQLENNSPQEEHYTYIMDESSYNEDSGEHDYNCIADFVTSWESYGYGWEFGQVTLNESDEN